MGIDEELNASRRRDAAAKTAKAELDAQARLAHEEGRRLALDFAARATAIGVPMTELWTITRERLEYMRLSEDRAGRKRTIRGLSATGTEVHRERRGSGWHLFNDVYLSHDGQAITPSIATREETRRIVTGRSWLHEHREDRKVAIDVHSWQVGPLDFRWRRRWQEDGTPYYGDGVATTMARILHRS